MEIVTGRRGEGHVTSQQERDIYKAIFGEAAVILDVEGKLAATVISANEIQIDDGVICAEGCMGAIARGSTDSLTIANGAQNMLRTDLIVARYTRNAGTGVEDMSLVVIEGTPAASNPATPAHTSGEIAEGDTVVDFPIYKVNISGISIESVGRLVSVVGIPGIVSNLKTRMTTVENGITSLRTDLNDHMIRVDIACGARSCAANTGTVNFNIDISNEIPEGYTPFDVRCGTTQDYQFYCWMCDFVSGTDNQTVTVRIQKRSGTGGTIWPWICVTCVKEATS